jgi:hypothetical protein
LTVHIFVGPTLAGQAVLDVLPGAVLHPPVAHGDLLRAPLLRDDVVVIVDGYYHQRPSVRHKEILALLARGVVVIGCASMGALRAAELDEYGMIGNGAVYRMYREGVLDADDEVAVAHTPGPEYQSLTVPSVVVRHVVDAAVRTGVFDASQAAGVVDAARRIHYAQRSWQAMWSVRDASDATIAALAKLRKFVESHSDPLDVKADDTLDTLRKVAKGELPGVRQVADGWATSGWRNRHVNEWEVQFAVTSVDGIEVAESDIVCYRQIYLDDFPERWKRFVLERITGGEGATTHELTGLTLARAARCGLGMASMSDARRHYWLTERELAELTADEALVRVLVRSYRPLHPTRDLIEGQPDLVHDNGVRHVVAEAAVVNSEVASWGQAQTVDHLKSGIVQAHLAQVWRIDGADPAVLLAAARDRGFGSVAEATGAAQMFFLLKSFLPAASTTTG